MGRDAGSRAGSFGSVRTAWITAAGTVVSAVITAAVSLAVADQHIPVTAAPPTVLARVVNTGGAGTVAYSGPGLDTVPRVRGPRDGEIVEITCQVRRRMPDPIDDHPAWDRLVDGWWIPDRWTDLPKDTGDVPPSGLARC